jgi:hypothetical protein
MRRSSRRWSRSRIHRRTICKLEKGEAQPQRKTLAAIVGALSAGGVEFIGGGVQLAGRSMPKRSFPTP